MYEVFSESVISKVTVTDFTPSLFATINSSEKVGAPDLVFLLVSQKFDTLTTDRGTTRQYLQKEPLMNYSVT